MDPVEAAKLLSCPVDDEKYQLKWQILQRMHNDAEYRDAVVQKYDPPYKV